MFVLTDEYREELYKRGSSVELTERIEADGVVPFEIIIGGDSCSIWTHPPVERNDLMYFIIFKGVEEGSSPYIVSSKCARISLTAPEYIKCSDCTKDNWILNYEGKKDLCRILRHKKIWEIILREYMGALDGWNGKEIDISDLPIPDYMQLPEA